MDPSLHRLTFDANADSVLARVEAQFHQEGCPAIQMRREIVLKPTPVSSCSAPA
jgi:hypothetical protein